MLRIQQYLFTCRLTGELLYLFTCRLSGELLYSRNTDWSEEVEEEEKEEKEEEQDEEEEDKEVGFARTLTR